jgi:hypothetical protein
MPFFSSRLDLILVWIQFYLSTSLLNNFSEFPCENGHLVDHWIIFPEGHCAELVLPLWNTHGSAIRLHDAVAERSEIANHFFLGKKCTAVFLEAGTPERYIKYPLQTNYVTYEGYSIFLEHMIEKGTSVEIGFQSYHLNDLIVNWVTYTGKRTKIGTLKPGEMNILWNILHLGHKIELFDEVTNKVLAEYTARCNSFFVVGTAVGPTQAEIPSHKVVEEDIYRILRETSDSARTIKRRFTQRGFVKAALPKEIAGSIQAFFFNNDSPHHRAVEVWNVGDRHHNWWETRTNMIVAPWRLKGYWQSGLRPLVEEWVGLELEASDIYGLREYKNGSRLLFHTDRPTTHAASLIINVAQSGMNEPWPLQIYDHDNRLHEVLLEPGEMIFYESAILMHGRNRPLIGASFVNVFSHYRPAGDPNWFTLEKVDRHLATLGDIGNCKVSIIEESKCELHSESMKTISPTLAKISEGQEAEDLYHFWRFSAGGTEYAGSTHGYSHSNGGQDFEL